MQSTVLVADDDESIRDLLVLVLAEAGYNTLSAADGRTAVRLAQEQHPDVAVLDVMMPVMDGFAVCRALKADPRTTDIPVLLLTALAQTRSKVQGLDEGATDYITKPFEHQELLARLRTALGEKHRRDALAAEALTDALTALTNRRGLEQRLDQLLAHAVRAHEALSLLLFDADHFKRVNDTYGHDSGDIVLVALAKRAQETMRAQDVVGRFGGEEFLAILPGAGRSAAITAAERLRAHISADPIDTPDGNVSISVSVGAATYQPDMDHDRGSLITTADQALYVAKRAGRNRVVHADGQPTAPLSLPEPPEAALALTETLALRHRPTVEHMRRVAELCWQVGSVLGLAPDERARVALAGLLHDIGKLTLSPAQLDTADPLEEYHDVALHAHVQIGMELLCHLPSLEPLAILVAAHHERWDGSGYPRGLGGEAIPLGSRIIAVADTYDALTHARVPAPDAATALREAAGTRLDPAVVAAALRVATR